MRSIKSILAAIAGVAMLAVPITASAAGHHRNARDRAHYAESAPARRSFNVRNFAPARAFAPRAAEGRRFRRFGRDDDAFGGYTNYGYSNYGYTPPAPVYVPPAPEVNYAAPYYGSNCTAAQRAINIARHDRNTGHPAAANDVLRNHSQALASCPQVGGMAAYGNYGYGAQAYPYGYGAPSAIAPLLQYFVR